jgi:hypothetical protein
MRITSLVYAAQMPRQYTDNMKHTIDLLTKIDRMASASLDSDIVESRLKQPQA